MGNGIHHTAVKTGKVIKSTAQTTTGGIKHVAGTVGNGIVTGGSALVGGVVYTGKAIGDTAVGAGHVVSNGWHRGLGHIDNSVNNLDARIQNRINS